eukprot:gene244-296_t
MLSQDGQIRQFNMDHDVMSHKRPGYLLGLDKMCSIGPTPDPRLAPRSTFTETLMEELHLEGLCLAEENIEDMELDIASHKFCLALEAANCPGLVSPRPFYCLLSGSIPVISSHSSTHSMLPNGSYIDIDQFKSIRELVVLLHQLDKDDEAYGRYFQWRQDPRQVYGWGRVLDVGSQLSTVACDIHDLYIKSLTNGGSGNQHRSPYPLDSCSDPFERFIIK